MSKHIKMPIKTGIAKTPVIMQLESLECGAASLTMILAYYEKWIPLEQLRVDCGVSRDGAKATNVLRAARKYGLKAEGYRYSLEKLKSKATFPCIIHWDFNHFVVLKGFKHDKAYINDPGRGDVVLSMEDFDKSFTGVTLVFEPDEGFEPSGKKKNMLEFARKRFEGTGKAFLFVVITTCIMGAFGIVNPAFSRVFTDRILTGTNLNWINSFVLLLIACAILQTIAGWIQAVYLMKIDGKFAAIGNASFMWKVLRMPTEFFTQRMAGDIQQRQITNGEIAGQLINTFAPLVLNAFMTVFYLIIMISYSPLLAFIGVLSVVINLWISNTISQKRVNITRVQMRDQGKLAACTISGIEMIETIKSSGAENGFFEKWSGFQASVNAQIVKFTKLNQYLGQIPELVKSICDATVLLCGVLLVIRGDFTVGMVMAFQSLMTSFMEPAQTFVDANEMLQEMRTNMERIEDVMEYPLDPDFVEKKSAEDISEQRKLIGNIELKDISFGYSRLEKPLVTDFSITIKPGQSIAIVGASGCGKSTIAKLISGLYRPWSGEILFDGKKYDEIPRAVLKGSISVVDQDIILFEDTIANNIRMWDESIEDFEVILAARDACIHDTIVQRKGGYNYVLSEDGRDFSGGQRQRIEIARTLAQDPSIIIMDEATSALDAKTENEVVKAIKNRGITCIVIAHRLSTIRDCDEIIVMEKGHIIERGTHYVLFNAGGVYTSLISND